MGKQGEQPQMLGNTVTPVKDTRLHHSELELCEEPSKEVHEETHLGGAQSCHLDLQSQAPPWKQPPPPLLVLVGHAHPCYRQAMCEQAFP